MISELPSTIMVSLSYDDGEAICIHSYALTAIRVTPEALRETVLGHLQDYFSASKVAGADTSVADFSIYLQTRDES